MDTTKLKNFAQYARRSLIEQVEAKLKLVLVNESVIRRENPEAIKKLEESIKASSRDQVIEQVAYIWFNRFCALRFMDVNRYNRTSVISPAEGQSQPEILAEAKMGHIDDELVPEKIRQQVFSLLDGRTPNRDPQAEAYRLLVIAVCNYWNKYMPFLFQRIEDYTGLLIPDDLLSGNSIISYTCEAMAPDSCEDVEVIGWLYQFYISERKDQVMARKSAVPTEDIPSVTQLFTPHWIVRYLVENSLGRLWLLNRPQSRLREQMPYYIEGEPETDFLKISNPEEIRLLDPAVGSGHMLTYAFDLLYSIYEEEGIEPTEIAQKILTHNLFGIEIDERAGELAAFALTMKARAKHRRFFSKSIKPNIIVLENVRFDADELAEYTAFIDQDLFNQPLLKLLYQFEEAKNFGSLIQPCLDELAISDVRRAIESKDLGGQLFLRETHLKVLRVLEQAEALTQRYHVVVANPPYMGAGAMNAKLKTFVAENFAEGKADLYGAFLLRDLSLLIKNGSLGMITIPNWLFLDSFSDLRAVVLDKSYLSSLVHNGRGVWGGDFGSCGFTIVKLAHSNRKGVFKRLFKRQGEIQSNEEIEANFRNTAAYPNFVACSADFATIPYRIIAYWTSPALRSSFQHSRPIGDLIPIKSGMSTTNNERFLRRWHEVSMDKTKLDAATHALATQSGRKWFPFKKGGDFRKWYGNDEYVLNWGNDGEEIKTAVVNNPTDPRTTHWSRRIFGTEYFFLPSITWSKISASYFSVRASGLGAIFSDASNGAFPKSDLDFYASFLNSILVTAFLKILSPTINSKAGDIAKIPLLDNFPASTKQSTSLLGAECIGLARADWDNFETSWDFRDQPLLRPGLKGATLEASWRKWEAQSTAAIRRMQELETENNRLFIAAYGLDGELQPAVPEEQITLARAEARRDMAAFLSYAVGCMFGRYALEKPGLVLANQGETIEDYLKQIPEPSFPADEDNVIPMLDGDWFTDDITERFRQFLRVTFGAEHYEENLKFIEDALGKDLRKYFLKDFYSDHVKRYKKRPIYWLFSSPKGSFNALIYMHRYRSDTVSVILNDYLREFRTKLAARLEHLNRVEVSGDASKAEKAKALKEINDLKKIIDELNTWEREVIYHLAASNIEIDLDDGVKVNYQKFGTALKKIPGLDKAEED